MVSTPTKPIASARPAASERAASGGSVCLRLPSAWKLTDDTFIELSRDNPQWSFETTEEGALLIMVGEGKTTSHLGTLLVIQIGNWSLAGGGGKVRGASGTVRLSEDVLMVPDASWVSDERDAAEVEDYDGVVLGTCPELIVEVRSQSDDLTQQQGKMERWIRYGALLGWLVDPQEETVWVYRPGAEPERLERPDEVGGEDVCEGLVVNFGRIWSEG